MSKYKKQIAITVSVIAIMIGILLLIFGKYIFKSKITAEEFETILGNYYTFSTESFLNYVESEEINEALFATNINYGRIEYYDFVNAKVASKKVDDMKSILAKSYKDDIKTKYFKFTFGNTEYFKIATNLEFVIISRIDNTLIFAYSDIEDQDDMEEILKELGY